MHSFLIHEFQAFLPMAKTAEKIVECNGFKEKIKVVRKHSRDVTTDIGK